MPPPPRSAATNPAAPPPGADTVIRLAETFDVSCDPPAHPGAAEKRRYGNKQPASHPEDGHAAQRDATCAAPLPTGPATQDRDLGEPTHTAQ